MLRVCWQHSDRSYISQIGAKNNTSWRPSSRPQPTRQARLSGGMELVPTPDCNIVASTFNGSSSGRNLCCLRHLSGPLYVVFNRWLTGNGRNKMNYSPVRNIVWFYWCSKQAENQKSCLTAALFWGIQKQSPRQILMWLLCRSHLPRLLPFPFRNGIFSRGGNINSRNCDYYHCLSGSFLRSF